MTGAPSEEGAGERERGELPKAAAGIIGGLGAAAVVGSVILAWVVYHRRVGDEEEELKGCGARGVWPPLALLTEADHTVRPSEDGVQDALLGSRGTEAMISGEEAKECLGGT
jgi:hypothetical protein